MKVRRGQTVDGAPLTRWSCDLRDPLRRPRSLWPQRDREVALEECRHVLGPDPRTLAPEAGDLIRSGIERPLGAAMPPRTEPLVVCPHLLEELEGDLRGVR